MSNQVRRIEKEPAELLKTFDRHPVDAESHLAQNKKMYADRAYRCFFKTYDGLEENSRQRRQLLKPKYSDSFDANTEQQMGEKKVTLKWLVEQMPNFEKNELCSNETVTDWEDTLPL